jgi:hypothetical protein
MVGAILFLFSTLYFQLATCHSTDFLAAGFSRLGELQKHLGDKSQVSLTAGPIRGLKSEFWDNPAIADLFFDGVLNPKGGGDIPCIQTFTSSTALLIHALEDITAGLDGADKRACTAAATAFGEMLGILAKVPSASGPDFLREALSAAATGLARSAASPILGLMASIGAQGLAPVTHDESLMRLVDAAASRVRSLGEGEFCLLPAGWLRSDGSGRIVV